MRVTSNKEIAQRRPAAAMCNLRAVGNVVERQDGNASKPTTHVSEVREVGGAGSQYDEGDVDKAFSKVDGAVASISMALPPICKSKKPSSAVAQLAAAVSSGRVTGEKLENLRRFIAQNKVSKRKD